MRWWLACLVSAVVVCGVTAAILAGVWGLRFVPIRERSSEAARAKAPRGEVTIYALFGCSEQLSQCERYARLIPVPGTGVVPNRFSSLALCREISSKYAGKPPDKRGRWYGRPGTWLECFARRTFPWYQVKGSKGS